MLDIRTVFACASLVLETIDDPVWNVHSLMSVSLVLERWKSCLERTLAEYKYMVCHCVAGAGTALAAHEHLFCTCIVFAGTVETLLRTCTR